MKRKIENVVVRLLVVVLLISMVFPMVTLAADEELPQLETPVVVWDKDNLGKVTWQKILHTSGFEVKLYKVNDNEKSSLVYTTSVSGYSCNLRDQLAKNSVIGKPVYVTVKAKNRKNENRPSELGTTELYFNEAELDWRPDYDRGIYQHVEVDENDNWSLFKAYYYEKCNKKLWKKEDYYYYDDDYDYDEDYNWSDCDLPPASNHWRSGWSENRMYYYEDGVRIKNCWYNIDGKWYYFDGDGKKQTSTFIEKYYVNKEGIMIDGDWFQYNYDSYYAKRGGAIAIGWEYINGNWYYFDSRGINQKGIFVNGNNGTRYYVKKKDGTMPDNEFFQYEYQKYFAKPGGDLARGWYNISGVWYYFDDSTGRMLTNQWAMSNGSWFYLGEDGAMLRNSWVTYKGDRYYVKAGGEMALGETWINGVRYYFNTDGGSRQGALIQ